jgi:hypothetical protein
MNIGDKIIIDYKLIRKANYRENPTKKYWHKKQIKETEAYIIGVRNISDGYVTNEYEVGMIYNQLKYHKAFLVVVNINQNPFYVFAKDFK